MDNHLLEMHYFLRYYTVLLLFLLPFACTTTVAKTTNNVQFKRNRFEREVFSQKRSEQSFCLKNYRSSYGIGWNSIRE